MKRSSRLQKWLRTAVGTLVLVATLAVGLDMNAIVSLADSTGKITATSAKIRKEPSTDSETVGSAVQDAKVSVVGQITGSDGYTWYKVSVDGGNVGYIRSDLMEITDGSTPATVVSSTTPTTSATATTSTPDEPLVDVAEVEPVSASVSGSSPVRVRQNASTTSRIVTTAQGGLALTVVGQATGTDNKEWYQVNFISNGSEVSGFIRADYVSVSGELVPAGSVAEPPVEETPEVKEEPEETKKAWETFYTEEDSKWHLVDNTTGNSYDIAQIFSSVEANTKTLQDTLKENKNQQIIIIILVILAIGLATGISFLFFKLKDMADSAYYNEVEQETMRRRTADRPVSRSQGQKSAGQRPAGSQSAQRPAGQRPAGQRPAGSQSAQRPAGQRPAGSQSAQRPASSQSGQRPVGQRPAGSQSAQRPVGQRPAGSQSAQRPVGQRPAGGQSAQRPVGQRPAGGQGTQRPAGSAQAAVRQRPVQEEVQDFVTDDTIVYETSAVEKAAQAQPAENAGWQPRNFVNEDEMEYQFLDLNEGNE